MGLKETREQISTIDTEMAKLFKYENYMSVFEKLLYDADDKVRMEAPEIFRVLGKRKPEFVRPYVKQLQQISETDENRVVRIHCSGAIKATSTN